MWIFELFHFVHNVQISILLPPIISLELKVETYMFREINLFHHSSYLPSESVIFTDFLLNSSSRKMRAKLSFHSVEIPKIYSHTFFTKISWKQHFTNEVTKNWFDGKKISVRENFAFFHTVQIDRKCQFDWVRNQNFSEKCQFKKH